MSLVTPPPTKFDLCQNLFLQKLHVTTHTWRIICHFRAVRRNFDKQLAIFVRKKRGELSYVKFAQKVGLSDETLRRVETLEQHLSVDKLETLVTKLHLRLKDIFPGEF